MSEYIVCPHCHNPLSQAEYVKVVRCRDCKYADISYEHAAVTGELHCYGYLVESWDWYNDMPSDGVKVKPDGYCAWAERRMDE